MMPQRPHFIIKNKFQRKDALYSNILNADILSDVCQRITGNTRFTVEFDNTGYNIGRLAKLIYRGRINYISFSENVVKSRNSSFQSFPSALVRYYQEVNHNKRIYFYFLPTDDNIETSYFIFMYRLMKTAGTIFLNELENLENNITSFNSVSDIIAQRDLNRSRNKGNNSTYVTIDENNILQIFGKTYGANKYETTLLCLAINKISPYPIELYEIREGNLKILPASAREVIINLGISVITSDLTLEREQFESNDSLRSPTFTYNLLAKLGFKKCALCECEIPQLIQGAHIWPVASIKNARNINQAEKLQSAMAGDNGIWLCNNHHKLFDLNVLIISNDGRLKYKSDLNVNAKNFINNVTVYNRIRNEVLTSNFLRYLEKRNNMLKKRVYAFVG